MQGGRSALLGPERCKTVWSYAREWQSGPPGSIPVPALDPVEVTVSTLNESLEQRDHRGEDILGWDRDAKQESAINIEIRRNTLNMKLNVRCVSAAVLLGTGLFTSIQAQTGQNPPKYRIVTLDYHKPEPGKTGEYLRVERQFWKPVHQERVNKGKIAYWKLYAVSFPNGDKQEYDYVTMTEFANFADLEAPYAGIDMAAVLGESKYKEMRGMTSAVQKLTRKDTLALQLSTANWSESDNQALQVHYLKAFPGKAADLLKAQREFYWPMGEDQIKSGRKVSWATTVVRYPEALDHPYSHVSFNGFASLAEMEQPMEKEIADKWGPKFNEVNVVLGASRSRVRGELWRLVDHTQAK